MDHDQRFKALLLEFLPEFFHLFFPEWADRFDFTDVQWLEQEIFPDPPHGERRSIDLVAQLPVNHAPDLSDEPGGRWLVLVHVEIESADNVAPLRRRMFEYHRHLRNKYEQPVLSIGLYLRVGLEGIGWDVYEERFWGRTLVHFEYPYIGLPALDGEHYLGGANLLGAALAALMRLPAERRMELGREAWRRLVQSQENEHRRYLLSDCIAAYIPRNEAERQVLESQLLLTTDPGERTMIATIWDRARDEGKMEAQREFLLIQLEERFGQLAEPVRQRLAQMSSEQMKGLVRAVMTAASLKELGLES